MNNREADAKNNVEGFFKMADPEVRCLSCSIVFCCQCHVIFVEKCNRAWALCISRISSASGSECSSSKVYSPFPLFFFSIAQFPVFSFLAMRVLRDGQIEAKDLGGKIPKSELLSVLSDQVGYARSSLSNFNRIFQCSFLR